MSANRVTLCKRITFFTTKTVNFVPNYNKISSLCEILMQCDHTTHHQLKSGLFVRFFLKTQCHLCHWLRQCFHSAPHGPAARLPRPFLPMKWWPFSSFHTVGRTAVEFGLCRRAFGTISWATLHLAPSEHIKSKFTPVTQGLVCSVQRQQSDSKAICRTSQTLIHRYC